jgi:hypothetical protein
VEYLRYRWRQGRGQKAEGRRQKAEGKEEGCKVQGNNDCLGGHDITPISDGLITQTDPRLLQKVGDLA